MIRLCQRSFVRVVKMLMVKPVSSVANAHPAADGRPVPGILQFAVRAFMTLILSCAVLSAPMHADQQPPVEQSADHPSPEQLLRLAYDSAATGLKREYFVYLPQGYQAGSEQRWPVMLFLHGNGQRGDGLDDLDYVLRHGPLMEAWLQKRPLPFIIISPQLPLFGELEAIADRKIHPRPVRQEEGVPERNNGYPSDMPIQRRNSEEFPPGPHQSYDPFSEPAQLPQGWNLIDEEVMLMLDQVLEQFQADPSRVYLTGISLGGFGTFHLAAKYPERWAAIAPIVGVGTLDQAARIAAAKIPVWMFGGGRDQVIKPHWLYETARALEEGSLPVLRFTVHEDMDHDAWKRVYAGNDLFDWFLQYSTAQRPAPEKSAE